MLLAIFTRAKNWVTDATRQLGAPDVTIEKRKAFLYAQEGEERADMLIMDRAMSLALCSSAGFPLYETCHFRSEAILGLAEERGYQEYAEKRQPSPTV